MKSYFLTRGKTFVEVELEKTTGKYRLIKFKSGDKKNKSVKIHPDGVAWGNMYPRLFESDKTPEDVFIFKGRVLLKNANLSTKLQNLVPHLDDKFRFQPKTRDIVDAINANEPVLLTGGGGGGKTTHIEQLANRSNQPTLRINFSVETRISDLLGKVNVKDGKTYWTDGVLPTAMRNGYWLILDEIDAADPSVLMLLHPVLEDGGSLVLKENDGEVVRKHPNFRIFGTANTIGAMEDRANAYAGTNKMNNAFVDRWTAIMWPTLPFKEELKVLKSKVAGLKHKWAVKICEFAGAVRNKKFDDYDFPGDTFSTRQVLKWGKKTALLRSAHEGAQVAWLDKIPASEHENVNRLLQLYFGKGHKKNNVGVDILERRPRRRRNAQQ